MLCPLSHITIPCKSSVLLYYYYQERDDLLQRLEDEQAEMILGNAFWKNQRTGAVGPAFCFFHFLQGEVSRFKHPS